MLAQVERNMVMLKLFLDQCQFIGHLIFSYVDNSFYNDDYKFGKIVDYSSSKYFPLSMDGLEDN